MSLPAFDQLAAFFSTLSIPRAVKLHRLKDLQGFDLAHREAMPAIGDCALSLFNRCATNTEALACRDGLQLARCIHFQGFRRRPKQTAYAHSSAVNLCPLLQRLV